MSEYGEGIISRLHPLSPLKNENNAGHKFIDNTIGEYLDNYENRDKFDQLFLRSATGKWLDLHGKELGVYREIDESDEDYRKRIILEKTMHNTIPELKSKGVQFWNYISNLNSGSEDYYFQFYNDNSQYVENISFQMIITDLLTDETVTVENTSDNKGLCIFNLASRTNPFKFTLKSQSNLYNTFNLDSSMIMKYNSKRNTLLLCNNSQIKQFNQIAFKLFGENGESLFNKELKILINSTEYTKTTNEDGVVWLNIDLNYGDYELKCYFEGDSDYNPCETTINVSSTSNSNDKSYIFVDCGIVHDLTSSELTSKNTYIMKDYLAHSDLNTQNYLINKFIVDGVLEWF